MDGAEGGSNSWEELPGTELRQTAKDSASSPQVKLPMFKNIILFLLPVCVSFETERVGYWRMLQLFRIRVHYKIYTVL